jgi:hypothetical protein
MINLGLRSLRVGLRLGWLRFGLRLGLRWLI